jgi:hypothetical protein
MSLTSTLKTSTMSLSHGRCSHWEKAEPLPQCRRLGVLSPSEKSSEGGSHACPELVLSEVEGRSRRAAECRAWEPDPLFFG